MGQLRLDSSISKLRYHESRTIFNDSFFARMTPRLMKVFPFGCCSFFTGDGRCNGESFEVSNVKFIVV